jgi:hypothetical protein
MAEKGFKWLVIESICEAVEEVVRENIWLEFIW